MAYTKPEVFQTDDVAEGVYASSGSGTPEQQTTRCKSIYMKGVYQQPSYNPIQDGYKIGRGCEGCPAWNGSSCRLITAPEEMNWDGDFRPSWEVQGHKPDEKGY